MTEGDTNDFGLRNEMQDPTPQMIRCPIFNAIWGTIKQWEIGSTNSKGEYNVSSGTGAHARTIYDAILKATLIRRRT